MFIFNKNNPLPRSRQSSIDSPVPGSSPSTSISTATSAVDAWVSHGSDASSFRDMPSPEQRARVRSGKRSSVFNLRSRSNTTSSTTSSFVSLAHPSMAGSDPTSPISPRDTRHLANQSFMDLPGPKRSLFRGKKGKRRSGQFSPNFDVAETEEVETTSKRTSVLRRGRKKSEDSLHHLKSRISIPFDFQHVTHTDRREYADLTGVRPGPSLHFQNFSSENLNSLPSTAASTPGLGSPPRNPDSSTESPKSGKSIRLTRSVESFSQPTSPRFHRSAQSAHQPPRVSSRLPLTRIDDLPEEPSLPPTRARSNRSSGFWDQFAPLSPPSLCDKLPTMTEEPVYVGNAVTTPDNSAVHSMSPLFTPDLGDVAEEPEYFTHVQTASSNPPCFDHFSFDSNQPSPVSRPTSRRVPNPRGPITRPISQMSEARGSPPRNSSMRRAPTARRKSNTWRVPEESWEDDVDFIYDNALEADCDFDWDRTSECGASDSDGQDNERPSTAFSQSTSTPGVTPEDECTVQAKSFLGVFPPLLSSASIVTGLEPRSAVSTSTDSGAHTLSDLFIPTHARQASLAEGFSLTPSLLVPADFKEQISHEDLYDDLLADYEGSDRHFPLLDAGLSVASSTRSSRVRSSKRSSYDSSLMSASQGSGSWNSSIRRSASSSSSLPELIHSRHARRSFNRMVDRLSEQVASCASFNHDDEKEVEDDDTTPPGRQSHNLTFFASEEEESETQNPRVFTEGEVRASLELARQGSTRSSRPSLHSRKYASSDGVTKLLAAQTPPASKPRRRAASSSNAIRAHRQPYLSLFPAPPKNVRQPTSPS